MNAIPRLLVVAALSCAAPALADLVLPNDPPTNADASVKTPANAPTPTPAAPAEPAPEPEPTATEPAATEILDAIEKRDAPGDVPRQPVPPPVDEELMKTLPPPSMGAVELIGPLAKTMLMLCVVLGIVYLTLYKGLGKLVERQNAGKRVKVVERVTLDQKRALFLVEIDGKQMLLAAGEGGVVLLKDVDATTGEVRSPAPPPAAPGGAGFAAKLADALKSKLPGAEPPVTTGLSRADAPIASAMSKGETKAGGVS